MKTLEIDAELGTLNGHAVGIILKELVRRAINVIRNERFAFEVQQKAGKTGKMDDLLTSADRKAQKAYVHSITECFPLFGILGEEDDLKVLTRDDNRLYITVDPLDGTKAFVRRQSHGVGTMVALIQDGKVLSAYVGDVNTQEIYGYRPGSEKVQRITEFNTCERLTAIAHRPLKEQHVALRGPEREYSEFTQQFIWPTFKDLIVDGSSIGLWFARLWKGEVGALICRPSVETPWDTAPIVGISEKLGYVFMHPEPNRSAWEEYEPIINHGTYRRDHDALVIHKSHTTGEPGSRELKVEI